MFVCSSLLKLRQALLRPAKHFPFQTTLDSKHSGRIAIAVAYPTTSGYINARDHAAYQDVLYSMAKACSEAAKGGSCCVIQLRMFGGTTAHDIASRPQYSI
eukprot:15610-Heterococcus_DN1.PRE.1